VDDKIRELLKELGSSIDEAVNASPRVKSLMQAIRDQGYEASLVLEATPEPHDEDDRHQPGHLTEDDINFLRRLKIEY
jgi:hypothetical protein